MTSADQKASMLGRCGDCGIRDLLLEGDCNLGFEGDVGGVTKRLPPSRVGAFAGDRDCGGELGAIRKTC